MSNQRIAPDQTLLTTLCSALLGKARLSPANFRSLEAAANEHSVRALLRDQLLDKTNRVDGCGTRGALRDLALREAAAEARRNQCVRLIIDSLARAGVPTLVFKGTALAHSHYARPELRERDDTDLAIFRGHLPTANDVLQRLGFHALAANEGSLIMRQRLYRRRDTDGLLHNIDLHWALSNSSRTARLDIRTLLARSDPLLALGTHARMPTVVDALLIACAHLDAHHVDNVRLCWLYDVHLVIERMSLAMRTSATNAAVKYNLENACAWVLTEVQHAFDSSLDGFERLLANGKSTRPDPRRIAQWKRELLTLQGNRERITWLWQHAVPSAKYIRDSAQADTSLWRLYLARLHRGIRHISR